MWYCKNIDSQEVNEVFDRKVFLFCLKEISIIINLFFISFYTVVKYFFIYSCTI